MSARPMDESIFYNVKEIKLFKNIPEIVWPYIYIYTSHVSDLFTFISTLADLASIYVMCLDISEHSISIRENNYLNDLFVI